MGDNICCPYLVILDCADSDDHKHLGCEGSFGDGPGVDNDRAVKWCLKDFKNCPMRPRGD